MSVFTIEGCHPLSGSVAIQGAKNSVLPILCATLLSPETCVIHNCPRLTDVEHTLDILRHLGCQVTWEGDTVTVGPSKLTCCSIPDTLMREMRSSVIFLGAMLARLGQAELSYPGGCELGPRPIDLHLSALQSLGAEVREAGGRLFCAGRLTGADIALSLPSVGCTENAMLSAVALGADVRGAGSSVITIRGGKTLHGGEYTVMADRIVACTYLSAVASAGGEGNLRGVDWRLLSTVTSVLTEAGCRVESTPDTISIIAPRRLRGVRPIRTAPYPGFPTDAQAVVMAALCKTDGATVFVENMFDSRYRHVDELKRMGADIRTDGRVAVVYGVPRLYGAKVRSTDLRGGAALAVAALGAEGESTLTGLGHIDRGYADLAGDLAALGAKIVRKEEK